LAIIDTGLKMPAASSAVNLAPNSPGRTASDRPPAADMPTPATVSVAKVVRGRFIAPSAALPKNLSALPKPLPMARFTAADIPGLSPAAARNSPAPKLGFETVPTELIPGATLSNAEEPTFLASPLATKGAVAPPIKPNVSPATWAGRLDGVNCPSMSSSSFIFSFPNSPAIAPAAPPISAPPNPPINFGQGPPGS